MEVQKYKSILEKYFDGTSSYAEVNQLQLFLNKYNGIDSDLIEAKELLGIISEATKETVDIDFDCIINAKPQHRIRKIYAFATAIAASVIIVLSLTFLLNISKQPIVYAYVNGQPITDKQEAIKYSQQAILSIQSNLNKGTQGLNYMNKLNKPIELLTIKN